ncbi:MAG TPA: formyltetrahydrofolate deformylase, partial [Niallia sp.]|nr:formyltetrahydrofolate deformylase [Niallia sp.]
MLKTLPKERNVNLQNRARLLVKCPDKPGIVSVLSTFLFKYEANIIESSQYSSDPENGT